MLTLHPGATNTNDVALRSERIVAELACQVWRPTVCVPVPVNLPYKRSRERREILESQALVVRSAFVNHTVPAGSSAETVRRPWFVRQA